MGKFIWCGEAKYCKECDEQAVGKQMEDFLCGEHWDYERVAGIMSSNFAHTLRRKLGENPAKHHMVFNEDEVVFDGKKMKCEECKLFAIGLSNGGYKCEQHTTESSISADGIEIYADKITISKVDADNDSVDVTFK